MGYLLKGKMRHYERQLLDVIFEGIQKDFQIMLPGVDPMWDVPNAKFTLYLQDVPLLIRGLLCRNDYKLGRAFVKKKIDIEGDIIAACRLQEHFLVFWNDRNKRLKLFQLALKSMACDMIESAHRGNQKFWAKKKRTKKPLLIWEQMEVQP